MRLFHHDEQRTLTAALREGASPPKCLVGNVQDPTNQAKENLARHAGEVEDSDGLVVSKPRFQQLGQILIGLAIKIRLPAARMQHEVVLSIQKPGPHLIELPAYEQHTLLVLMRQGATGAGRFVSGSLDQIRVTRLIERRLGALRVGPRLRLIVDKVKPKLFETEGDGRSPSQRIDINAFEARRHFELCSLHAVQNSSVGRVIQAASQQIEKISRIDCPIGHVKRQFAGVRVDPEYGRHRLERRRIFAMNIDQEDASVRKRVARDRPKQTRHRR
ncbi:MAG: hypothetical protein ABS35_25215 [Kaistia sp. SCN 65-12]|nr:MAG: hypothetical protein ABS35_25215 [Kaistia sp. SCN 65-12]